MKSGECTMEDITGVCRLRPYIRGGSCVAAQMVRKGRKSKYVSNDTRIEVNRQSVSERRESRGGKSGPKVEE